MSQNLEKKKKLVTDYTKKAKDAKSIVISSCEGINVEQVTRLRNDCRKNQVEYRVFKNRLLKRALEGAGINLAEKTYDGQISVAFGSDETMAAKVIVDAGSEMPIEVRCGFAFGKILSALEIKALARIPSREVLLSQLLGVITAPVRNLAIALAEVAKTK